MSDKLSFNDRMETICLPQYLARALESEMAIRLREEEIQRQEKGRELSQRRISAIERRGAVARLIRDTTNYNPYGVGNALPRPGDKSYEEGFRDISISKGNAVEEAVTGVFRSWFSNIDNQTNIELEDGTVTRSDLIARNAGKDAVICGMSVKKGESVGVEIKCGDERYLRRQIKHIDTQLSGYDKLEQPVDHKVIMVSADILRVSRNCLTVDENGRVSLLPKARKNSYAAKFMANADKHGATVYMMPFYAVDMTYSYLQAYTYLRETPSRKVGFKDNLLPYQVLASDKIPGLEAIVMSDGSGWVQLDGKTIADIAVQGRGVLINKDLDHFVRLVGRSDSIDDRINMAMDECEKFLQSAVSKELKYDTIVLDSIMPEFTFTGVEAVTEPSDKMPRAKTELCLTEEGMKDLISASGLALKTNLSPEEIMDRPEPVKVVLTSYYHVDRAALTVKWGDIERNIALPPAEQSELNLLAEDYLGRSLEDHIASKTSRSTVYPSRISDPVIVDAGGDKEVRFRVELYPDEMSEILRRSNTAGLLGLSSTTIGGYWPKVEFVLGYEGPRLDIISDKIKNPVRVPLMDTEKLIFLENAEHAMGMTKNEFLKNAEEQAKGTHKKNRSIQHSI